jgi:hypothetical protein
MARASPTSSTPRSTKPRETCLGIAAADHPRLRGPPASSVGTRDISLAGRIIAAFPERLTEAQRQPTIWPCWANW